MMASSGNWSCSSWPTPIEGPRTVATKMVEQILFMADIPLDIG
jgi:hypothetical protein